MAVSSWAGDGLGWSSVSGYRVPCSVCWDFAMAVDYYYSVGFCTHTLYMGNDRRVLVV